MERAKTAKMFTLKTSGQPEIKSVKSQEASLSQKCSSKSMEIFSRVARDGSNSMPALANSTVGIRAPLTSLTHHSLAQLRKNPPRSRTSRELTAS